MDAKVSFDDNADFRQPDIHNLRDITQEDQREVAASEQKLNYIGLDGSIGCLGTFVNLPTNPLPFPKLHSIFDC